MADATISSLLPASEVNLGQVLPMDPESGALDSTTRKVTVGQLLGFSEIVSSAGNLPLVPVVLCNATGGNFALVLPDSVPIGSRVKVCNYKNSGVVTLNPQSGTVDGQASITLGPRESVDLYRVTGDWLDL